MGNNTSCCGLGSNVDSATELLNNKTNGDRSAHLAEALYAYTYI